MAQENNAREHNVQQVHRRVSVKTALPEDHLAFSRMSFSEGLSQLFEMDLELLSREPRLDPNDLLGRNLTVRFTHDGEGATRHFNGLVRQFSYRGRRGRSSVYSAKVAPWPWLLTQTTNTRIFADMSAKDIVTEVLGMVANANFEFKAGAGEAYEYTVQYQETDFAFVSRLMEREGYYYWFEHEDGDHKMIIADSMSQHEPASNNDRFEFRTRDAAGARLRQCVTAWDSVSQILTDRVEMQNFDFKQARADLSNEGAINRQYKMGALQQYIYPGAQLTAQRGGDLAKTRVEAIQANQTQVFAESTLPGVETARKFTIVDHPEEPEAEFLITSASYELSQDEFESGRGGGGGEVTFSNTFTAMPATEVFRAPFVTPWPRVHGPQTAIVSNENNQELDLDDFGRVRVKFHWVRGEEVSCRVRASQPNAGAGWGSVFNPRDGQEVIVEFLNGDPDRPIITGRVYNNVSEYPYPPAEKPEITTIKTNSVNGSGFNELQFNDVSGEEHVFLHSQKDTHLRTRNDHIEWIGNDEHQQIDAKSHREVGKDSHETIGGDNHLTISGANHVDVTSDHLLKSGGNIVEQAGQSIHIKGGQKVIIEAGMQLSLKVGGNFVNISMAGVDIVGTMVKINSGGSAGSGPGTSPAKAEPPIEPREEEPGAVSPALKARSRTPTRLELDKNPVAAALLKAADSGAPFCAICQKTN